MRVWDCSRSCYNMKAGRKPRLMKKVTNVKRQRVDKPVVPGLEDEATEVEHLLDEPKREQVSVDEVFCFGKENLEEHLKMEDFSYAFDYGWKFNCGGLDGQGGDDLKLDEVLDGLLDEVDEVDDIHAADDLAGACEGFLLDIEFPEKLSDLECVRHEGSKLRNSSSESHSPGFSGSSNSAGSISESSVATIQRSNIKTGVLEKIVNCDASTSNFRCQTAVTDTILPTIEHMQTFDESDDDYEKPLVSFILSTKKVKSSVKVRKGDTLLRHKRLRKPTSRYIEEFSRNSVASGKNKRLKVGSQGDLPQLPSELQQRRERPKKIVPKLELESECELSASESEDEHKRTKRSKTSCDRRKHQKMWSLSEVIKLVDGIAQCGVGRWTAIKRLLFASSAHRTPVDLRDKWRNLLRSSSAHKYNKKECEINLKHAVRPLPMTIVCRIHELATMHPYPMARGSKKPSIDYIPSSKQPTTSKGDVFYSNGRNLRRKKLH